MHRYGVCLVVCFSDPVFVLEICIPTVRSEKIRTYNYPQNRISDHRIGLTVHNLTDVLDGALEVLIDELVTSNEAERLAEAGL